MDVANNLPAEFEDINDVNINENDADMQIVTYGSEQRKKNLQNYVVSSFKIF